MKKICIFFFSGTGMTKYVVDKLSKELGKYQISADCFQIEGFQIHTVDLLSYDLLGIAYPVHAFNAPKIVINFANHLPKSNGLNTFIIGSMGEDNPINYASSNTLIEELKDKGYHVFYNIIFGMPCNFIIKYEPSKVNFILDTVNREIPTTAKEIINQTVYFINGNLTAKFLSIMGKAEWLGAHVIGKFFTQKVPVHNAVSALRTVQTIIFLKEKMWFGLDGIAVCVCGVFIIVL